MSIFKKCKVVMLPTNEKAPFSSLYKEDDGKLAYDKNLYSYGGVYHFNLYITSDDEIKEGDWFIIFTNNVPVAPAIGQFNSDCKKLIATTDESLEIIEEAKGFKMQNWKIFPQPSQSFIEKYIEEYNKGNEITEVLVEYIDNGEEDWIGDNYNGEPFWNEKLELKINLNNTINIKPIKDSWSRDEVIKLLNNLFYETNIRTEYGIYTKKDLDKWIEEKL